MAKRGAEFSDVTPRLATGQVVWDITLESVAFGAGTAIDTADVQQVTALNSFRLGQQIFFHLGVAPEALGEGNYISRVILKPWWLRPNIEYRAPGVGGWLGIDRQNFGDGPDGGDPLYSNRYCWIPSPKRLDTTQYDTTPIPTAPARHSYSMFEDDLWVLDMPDFSSGAYPGLFGANQDPARWVAFMYPAMGFALGFTWDVELAEPGQFGGTLPIKLTWHVGTLGGSVYQESIG